MRRSVAPRAPPERRPFGARALERHPGRVTRKPKKVSPVGGVKKVHGGCTRRLSFQRLGLESAPNIFWKKGSSRTNEEIRSA